MDTLAVPELEKQWLISPPPSPPVGWEPRKEDPPVVDADLVAALQGMDPTVPHRIFNGEGAMPSISVALVETDDEEPASGDVMSSRKSSTDTNPIRDSPPKKIGFMSMPPPWAKGTQVHGGPWQAPKNGENVERFVKSARPPSKYMKVTPSLGPPPVESGCLQTVGAKNINRGRKPPPLSLQSHIPVIMEDE